MWVANSVYKTQALALNLTNVKQSSWVFISNCLQEEPNEPPVVLHDPQCSFVTFVIDLGL